MNLRAAFRVCAKSEEFGEGKIQYHMEELVMIPISLALLEVTPPSQGLSLLPGV